MYPTGVSFPAAAIRGIGIKPGDQLNCNSEIFWNFGFGIWFYWLNLDLKNAVERDLQVLNLW